MRLGVRVGRGCEMLLDSKMQDLNCHFLQFDEVWGFIGKKERHLRVDDNPGYGDVWTFCAIDAETKLVPDRKSTRLNSSHANISYAVFCSKKTRNGTTAHTISATVKVKIGPIRNWSWCALGGMIAS